eukprot:1959709-Ditylum_brightwellii.AAC.1
MADAFDLPRHVKIEGGKLWSNFRIVTNTALGKFLSAVVDLFSRMELSEPIKVVKTSLDSKSPGVHINVTNLETGNYDKAVKSDDAEVEISLWND